MSELSDKLNQVNTDIRAAITAEHDQVNGKLDELVAKIAELEAAVGTDEAVEAAIEDTKKIIAEIQGIYEPTTPTDV